MSIGPQVTTKELTYKGPSLTSSAMFLEILLRSFAVCFSKPQRAYTESFIRVIISCSMIKKKIWKKGKTLLMPP